MTIEAITATEVSMEDASVPEYTYTAKWSPEDEQFVATCPQFPSLSWLADTASEALRGLRELVGEVVQELEANGEPVPQVTPRTAGVTLEQAKRATSLINHYTEQAAALAQIRRAAIREALGSGMTQREVAKALGLSPGRLTQILKRP